MFALKFTTFQALFHHCCLANVKQGYLMLTSAVSDKANAAGNDTNTGRDPIHAHNA